MADTDFEELKIVISAEDNATATLDGVMSKFAQMPVSAAGVATGINSATRAVTGAATGMNTAAGTVTGAATGINLAVGGISDSSLNAALALQRSGMKALAFGQGLSTLTAPLTRAGDAVIGLGTDAVKTAISFEDTFAGVKKTVDASEEEFARLEDGIRKMATVGLNGERSVPLLVEDLNDLMMVGGQLGVPNEYLLEFTETMAKLGTATNLEGADGAATLARFMNVANVGYEDVERLGSTIVHLGNNFATSESEIANMAMRVGLTGNIIGLSAQDILAYSTAMSALGIQAEAGGSAISRIWSDIHSVVAAGGEGLEKFAAVSGKSAEEFAAQWKEDASGAFVDFIKGLNQSDDKLSLISQLGFQNVRDLRVLEALSGEKGVEEMLRALELANAAWEENNALQNEFNKKMETTQAAIDGIKNKIRELGASYGDLLLPKVNEVIYKLGGLMDKLTQSDDGTKKAVLGVGASVAALGFAGKIVSDSIMKMAQVKIAWGILKGGGQTLQNLALDSLAMGRGLENAGGAAATAGNEYSMFLSKIEPVAGKLDDIGQGSGAAFNGFMEGAEKAKYAKEIAEDLGETGRLAGESYSEFLSRIEPIAGKIDDVAGGLKNAGGALDDVARGMMDTIGLLDDVSFAGIMSALSPLMTLFGAFTGAYELFKLGVEGLEKYREKLGESGGEALAAAEELKEKSKEVYDLTNEAKTVEEYFNRYKELLDLVSDGSILPEEMAELKEIEQWFIDNYGEYITAEEKKNGVKLTTLDIIKDLINAKKELAEAEREETKEEIKKDSEKKRKNAQKAQKDIDRLTLENSQMGVKINGAQDILEQLPAIRKRYEEINKTLSGAERIQAIEKLRKNNEELFKSYSQLGLGELKLADLGAATQNLTNYINDLNLAIEENNRNKDKEEKSIEEYKQAIAEQQRNVIDDAFFNTGYGSIFELFQNGDAAAIDKAIYEVTAGCKELGMTGEETMLTLALFKNGFTNLNEVLTQGGEAVSGVEKDLNDYLHTLLVVPDNITFHINADGNIYTTVDAAWDKLQKIDSANVTAAVNVDDSGTPVVMSLKELIDEYGREKAVALLLADDNATFTIDGIEYKIAEYNEQTGIATLKANDSDATATLNTTTGEILKFGELESTATLKADGTPALEEAKKTAAELRKVWENTYTARLDAKFGKAPGFAKGTQNAKEGLAVVNDEKGVSDPRELIEHNGRFMMYEGRDRVVPLAKGDKVYTASQTKKILAGLPHFAGGNVSNSDNLDMLKKHIIPNETIVFPTDSGDNNSVSDAFKAASEEWKKFKDTHVVSVTEELEKWVALSKEFRQNEKDVAEIEKNIFSLMTDRNKELNDISKGYIEERTALNDWNDFGDSPLLAWNRVRERNIAEVNEGRKLWSEFSEEMSDLGSQMYSDRISQSEKWLEHEEKYNNLSADSYIAGLMRMRDYTEEYFAGGIISYSEYVEGLAKINDDIFDKQKEAADNIKEKYNTEFELWQRDADAWEKLRGGFDDWEKFSDSEIAFAQRKLDKIKEFYNAGKIDLEKYVDLRNDYSLDLYDAQAAEYDRALDKYSSYIEDLRGRFSEEEEALRSNWEVEDRRVNMTDISDQLDIYKNAVTDRGIQKYKELEDEMLKLQRDEELYRLQEENNAVISGLEEKYSMLEAMKSDYLSEIAVNTNIDISGIVSGISASVTESVSGLRYSLEQILDAIKNVSIEQSVYNDSSSIVVNNADDVALKSLMARKAGAF